MRFYRLSFFFPLPITSSPLVNITLHNMGKEYVIIIYFSINLFQKRLSERTANGSCRTRIVQRKELWVLNLILVVNNQQSKLVNDAGSI